MPLSVTEALPRDLQPHPWLPLLLSPQFTGSTPACAFALKPVLPLRAFSWNSATTSLDFLNSAPEWNSAFLSSWLPALLPNKVSSEKEKTGCFHGIAWKSL